MAARVVLRQMAGKVAVEHLSKVQAEAEAERPAPWWTGSA